MLTPNVPALFLALIYFNFSSPSDAVTAKIETRSQDEEQIKTVDQEKSNIPVKAADTVNGGAEVATPDQPVIQINDTLDDLAAYVAGISDHKFIRMDRCLLRDAAWTKYCAEMKDKSKLKTLPFGIGYKYNLGKSNLMLAQKKPLVACGVGLNPRFD